MRSIWFVTSILAASCTTSNEPAPGSRAEYEGCEPKLPPEEELCGENLVCQYTLDSSRAFCAPACTTPSSDVYMQSPECPEFEGFSNYCGESPYDLSCIINCDASCPDGLGLVCDTGRCVGQDEP